MMMASSSLIKWLATFQLDGQVSIEPDNDACYHLADGYVCARILNQICPRYFTDKWLDGIKPVPPNGSWRLRVSNLKRILQKIHDYASDLQSPQFKPDSINPDVAVIAQNFDADQISRLIQLILFCAINCEKKQAYIETIGNLPTQVKQDIKEAIEELLVRDSGGQYGQRLSSAGDDSSYKENGHNASTSSQKSTSVLSPSRLATSFRNPLRRDSSHSMTGDGSRRSDFDFSGHGALDTTGEGEDLEGIKQRLSDALIAKDERAQACHELEIKLRQLQMEKEQLISENEKLTSDKSQTKSNPDKTRDFRFLSQNSRDSSEAANRGDLMTRLSNPIDENSQNLFLQQNIKLQSEINRLKGDIIKLETEKEEYRLKSNLLKEDRDIITKKHDELRNKAEQAKRLQDELDEQRHISEKVTSYEAMVENLMKKNNEMKRELKDSKEKNTERIQRIISLEEENKQLASEINRIDIYKKQLQEVQVKLSEETHRADLAEVELTRLAEKFDVVKKENERLYDVSNQFIRGSHSTPIKGKNLESEQSPHDISRGNKEYSPVNLKDNEQDSDLARSVGRDAFSGEGGPMSSEQPVTDLRDKIARLECENQLLQSKLAAKRENDQSVLGGLLDSANDRCTQLELENRQSRKKIMMLEGHLKDLVSSANTSGSSALRNPTSDNSITLFARVEELQKLLFQKEQEIMDSENKYRKNLQKAKDLIKTLNNNQSLNSSIHPSNASSVSLNLSSLDETNLLRQRLKELEHRLIEREREFYEFRKFKEIHERLIISAFYGLVSNYINSLNHRLSNTRRLDHNLCGF